ASRWHQPDRLEQPPDRSGRWPILVAGGRREVCNRGWTGFGASRRRGLRLTRETSANVLPEHLPSVGDLVQVRSRRWLVEEILPSAKPGHSAVIRLACADDDAQGQALDVFWYYELDRRILEE